MDYEQRMERLDEVTHPKPLSDFIYGTFNRFRGEHPWVGGQDIRPKSIGREMLEGYMSFADYVKRYGLQRSEGVLLRYLSQLYKTLNQSVPELSKNEPVLDALGFFRTLLEHTDTSLLEEWESLLHPELRAAARRAKRKTATETLWIEELAPRPQGLRRPRPRRDAPPRAGPRQQGLGGSRLHRPPGARRSREPLGPRALRERPSRPSSPNTASSSSPPKPAATSGPRSAPPESAPGRSPTPSSTRRATTSGRCIGSIDLRESRQIDGPLLRLERIGA